MTRLLASLILALSLVACGPRGDITLDPQAAQVGSISQIYYGTTRAPDPETGGFSAARSSKIRYGRLDISIPPDRKPGQIEWPRLGTKPNPKHDFLTVRQVAYPDTLGFEQAIAKALHDSPGRQGEVTVFIHGYNNTFAEGEYRFAQLSHDLKIPAISVSYAWPSAGRALRYAYDRDSILFARDGLEDLLTSLTHAGARRIILVAHSLGSELTMEVLRQMALDHNRQVMSRIGGVILLSPDIDTQVFRRQAKVIGKLPKPFLIFTSGHDRALSLSATLTGRSSRLGNLADLDKVAALDVTVVDVSAFSVGSGHFNAGNSPTLLRILAGVTKLPLEMATRETTLSGLLPGVAQRLNNAVEIIVSPDQVRTP